MSARGTSRRTFLAGALGLAAAARIDAGPDAPFGAARAAEPTRIRASTIPIADNAAFEVARERGFFAAQGLEVDTTPTPGGAAGIPALVSGGLQVASSNIVSIVLAAAQGLDLVIVAAGDATSDAPPDLAGLVAKPAGTFGDGKGIEGKALEGRRVAVNSRNNIVWLYVREWVRKTGGDPAKVSYVEVPFPQMTDAVQGGRVDAAMLVEPFLSAGLKGGGLESLAWPYSAVQPRIPVSQFVTTRAYAKANPEIVARFRAGHDAAVDWTNAHLTDDAFLAVVSGFTRTPVERIRAATMPVFVKTVDPGAVAFVAELMKRQGLLKSEVDIRALIDPALLPRG